MSKKQDDYLDLKLYAGHARTQENPDFSTFEHEGEYYFAMHDASGQVVLRSEGYSSEKGRDNGIASVIKNKEVDGRFSVVELMNKFFVSLKAGNNQEIAKSGPYDTMALAQAYIDGLGSGGAIAVAAGSAAVSTGKIDISGLKVLSVTRNELGETKNYGERKLVKENRRDLGEKSRKVIGETRNVVNETRNQISENKVVTKMAGAMALAALAAPTMAQLKTKTTWEEKPLPAKKEFIPVAPSDPNGGFPWWLPILFLLPFLLIWGCPPPVIPPLAVAVAMPIAPVAAAPVCDCDSKSHYVFDIPDGPPPKTSTRLGISPEFGNSHALDAPGFYNKLKNRFNTNAADKKFLNDIFDEMGYDGFGEATAKIFKEVTLKSGVEGNLGGKGTEHKTYYRKLVPTDKKDLEAFRITAKNGCHLHFMKTCGNHFFTKPCPADYDIDPKYMLDAE